MLDQVKTLAPTWELLRPALFRLNSYAVAFRYPGMSANRGLAREALAFCKMIRAKARGALKLRG